jgi:REP element-mobilizing transposase RayT
MARQPRLTVPGYPHHIILRGNNRQAIVLDDADRRRLLDGLGEQAALAQVAVNAYVLMSNHLHLLLTPETAEGIPRLMQALGRNYVQAFNRRHARTGTLWEGRYRSTLIEAERYLLACMAYIDLNPVRAGMVATAADYPWSSHGHMIGLRIDPLITPTRCTGRWATRPLPASAPMPTWWKVPPARPARPSWRAACAPPGPWAATPSWPTWRGAPSAGSAARGRGGRARPSRTLPHPIRPRCRNNSSPLKPCRSSSVPNAKATKKPLAT